MNKEIKDKNKEEIYKEEPEKNVSDLDSRESKASSLDPKAKEVGDTPKKETQKKPSVEDQSPKKSVAPSTVVGGSGINLIPTMSEEEVVVAERKKKVNVSSLVSLSLLFSISILVIGFNIVSRVQLNAQREKLNEQERRIQGYSQIISGNTEILERVFLYNDIQEENYSRKSVVEYLETVASKAGSNVLNDFTFPSGESFEFSGEGQSYEDVAKLWYLLTNDVKTEDIELKSFSRSQQTARFTFRGTVKTEEFPTLSGN